LRRPRFGVYLSSKFGIKQLVEASVPYGSLHLVNITVDTDVTTGWKFTLSIGLHFAQ